MKTNTPLYVAVVEVSRHYGGPEEGGWWYDRSTVLGWWKARRSELAHRSSQRSPLYVERLTPEALRGFERVAKRDFGYLPVKPKGYRGRGSVIGQPDVELRFSPTLPQDYPTERPHYE